MIWFFWALLLIVQNASFTLVSRARNSGSLGYHAIAAVFSNGVWYASQLILIDIAFRGRGMEGLPIYIASTVLGSVAMHWLSMRYLERGKRRVGAQ